MGMLVFYLFFFCSYFFFSSRRRHTRFDCDWSSDVCSSDLCFHGINFHGSLREESIIVRHLTARVGRRGFRIIWAKAGGVMRIRLWLCVLVGVMRSEERRVGKSVDLGGRCIIKKKTNRNMSV